MTNAKKLRLCLLKPESALTAGCRQAAAKKALRERIEALCAESPRDGYRRITQQLGAEGLVVNHRAVARS